MIGELLLSQGMDGSTLGSGAPRPKSPAGWARRRSPECGAGT